MIIKEFRVVQYWRWSNAENMKFRLSSAREEVLKEHFSMRIIKKVLSVAAEWKLSLAMEAERKIYMDHNASVFYRNDFQHKIYGSSRAEQKILCIKNKISYEENFEDIKSDTPKIHKICTLGQRAAIEWLEKELEQDAETIQKKKWDDYWYLELLPKGCNKGSAVKKLNRKLGIYTKTLFSIIFCILMVSIILPYILYM